MLVTTEEILKEAFLKGYAVCAFNVFNMEQIQAVVWAAEKEKLPVIIQTSESALKYAGIDLIFAMIKCVAQKSSMPVALHLDHGTTEKIIKSCIKLGWTSIMIDASDRNFKENILKTKQIVKLAHFSKVTVEAEVGRVLGVEDSISVNESKAYLTEPSTVSEFVEKTDIDFLAIAIGTAHGKYYKEPKLDFDRLKQIKMKINIPLVLHGASDVAEEDLRHAARLGINKINIDTNLRQAFVDGCNKILSNNPEEYNARKLCNCAREEMIKVVNQKIKIFSNRV